MRTYKYTHLGGKLTVSQPLPVFPSLTQSVWAESNRESPSAIGSKAARLFPGRDERAVGGGSARCRPRTALLSAPGGQTAANGEHIKRKNKQHWHKHLCFVHCCVFLFYLHSRAASSSPSSLQVSRAPSCEGSAGRYSAGAADEHVGVHMFMHERLGLIKIAN